MSAPWPSARVLPLEEFPTAAPGLRFAVRTTGGPDGRADSEASAGGSGEVRGVTPDEIQHDADWPHPLAGTGKLFLAVAVARMAGRDPRLLDSPVTVRGEHRAAARSGTLRRMTGDLQLTVDDAMALVVGTGDGACTVALLELLTERGEDVLAEARRAAAALVLAATTFTGLELRPPKDDEAQVGESWGEGLVGATTAADLCTLLVGLVRAAAPRADPSAGLADEPDAGVTAPLDHLDPRAADRVLAWMGKAFEPAGLASALPGFGPRTIPHRTVSGVELLAPAGAVGCSSVLILPAGVGTGFQTACVAAYAPSGPDAAVEPAAVLGRLGLAVAAHLTAGVDVSPG